MNLIDVNNIDCTKLPKKLYPYMKDILDFFDAQPIIDAIPKADYEAKLKADLKAILVELQLEIEELDSRAGYDGNGMPTFSTDYIRKKKVNELIQQKINVLKGVEDGKDN